MRSLQNKHIHAVPIIIAFASAGALLIVASFAATRSNNVELESADLSGNAEVIEDIAASEGSFVQFDEGSQGNGTSDSEGTTGEAASSGAATGSTGATTGATGSASGTTGSTTGSVDSTTTGSTTGSTGATSGATTGTTGTTGTDTTGSTTGGTTGATGPTLVWSEEFNGSLPSTYFSIEHSTYGDGNNELQCYTPDQVSVSGGKLVLTAVEQTVTCPNGSTRTVTSGMVRTKNVEFSPGMSIEWSAKLTPADDANQGGLWPALWASGWAGGGWPTGGEWDGFEVMTAVDPMRTVYSLHWRNSAGNYQKTSTPIYSARNFSDNTHTFRFEYGIDGTLVWYRDGYETKRVTTLDTQQGYPAPFDQDMKELKINLALGGNPGALDTRALPATLEIGYIRIYQD